MVLNIKEIIKKWWIRDRKLIAVSVVIGIVFTIVSAFFTKAYSNHIQSGIADEVFRFHVLANSNEEQDQLLKIKVRDGVLEEMNKELASSDSKLETRLLLSENQERIKLCAEKIISENGYDYDVAVSLSKDKFPTKVYGDVAFPAGEYDALKIEIGSGQGNNWWCVMYPPLCFVDVTQGQVPQEAKDNLKTILTDEEYDIVVNAKSKKNIPVKVKFKAVEWWQERNNKTEKLAKK